MKLLSESTVERVYKALLERFGEPIGHAEPTVGIKDERGSTDHDYEDEPEEHAWDDVNEACESDEELAEVTPPGYEKVVKSLKKQPGVKNPWAVAWSMKNKGHKPKR